MHLTKFSIPSLCIITCAILFFLVQSVCHLEAETNEEKTITDSSGKSFAITKPFTKIISLYSAHTENLYSLGAQDQLIGIERSEETPAEAQGKPEFSYREDPERILATQPDLVLIRPMIERAHPEFIEKLRRAGITVISLQPNNIEEIFTYWRTLGSLTGRSEQAKAMIDAFRRRLATVQEHVKDIPDSKRPKVYFEAIHGKMKTFAADSIAMYVLQQAGGINVAKDADQVRDTNIAAYGKEKLLSHGEEIDIYLVQTGRMNPVEEKNIKDEPGFLAIKAVREGKIILIPEALVARPTMHLLDGIERLHAAFYPQFAK